MTKAVHFQLLVTLTSLCPTAALHAGSYVFTVRDGKTYLNDRPFLAKGLRCSNALISESASEQLIANLDTLAAHGVNTVSVFLMGSRFGDVKGYNEDGSLNPIYTWRLGRIIEAADKRGMVVLVGCLYWGNSKAKWESWTQAQANAAVANTVRWLGRHGYRNVFVDVDNEGMARRAEGFDNCAMVLAGKAADRDCVIATNFKGDPPPEADLGIHFSNKVPGKPYIESEGTPTNAPGGYWGTYSKKKGVYNYINIGLYGPAMKANQIARTADHLRRGWGYLCASTWLQCVPPHGPNLAPGGDGSAGRPGIRWWLEYLRDTRGPYRPPPPSTPVRRLEPRVVKLDFEVTDGSAGGIVAADLDGDGRRDFAVTAEGHIGGYTQSGKRLWHIRADVRVSAGSSESRGLPGHHAPGVQVADVDGDGRAELLHLDQSSTVHIRDGATGKEERAVRVPHPGGAERWEHLAVVNLRGKGDRDLVLQATNSRGYRVGRYVAAFAIEKLGEAPLWKTDKFGALAHGSLRAADLDGDGRDELCGFTLLGPDGKETPWRYHPIAQKYGGGASFHIDHLTIADVRPDRPGLEVVLLEEGRNYIGVVNFEHGILSWVTNRRQEPQNAAVGEFDPARPGLEVWCRSRYNTHQKPWILDARGELLGGYEMDDVAPRGWTDRGVEVIAPIHWSGEETQLVAAKERHEPGDVCLFEALTGRFVLHLPERADRLYVADVSGDWREEIIVVNRNEIHIYENPAPNPRPDQPRLWEKQHYRRAKMTWDYYSP